MWCRRPTSPSRLIAHRQDRGGGKAQLGAIAAAGNGLPRALGGTIGRHPRLTLPSDAPMHAHSASPQTYRPRRAAHADAGGARAVRLPAAPRAGRRRRSARCCGCRSAGARRSGSCSGSPTESELAPERLAEPDAVLPPRRARRPGRARGLDRRRSTARRRRGRSRSCCRPEPPAGSRRKQVLVAELTDAGARRARGEAPLNDRQRARSRRSSATGPRSAAALGTPTLRRLEGRGLVAIGARAPSARAPGVGGDRTRGSTARRR